MRWKGTTTSGLSLIVGALSDASWRKDLERAECRLARSGVMSLVSVFGCHCCSRGRSQKLLHLVVLRVMLFTFLKSVASLNKLLELVRVTSRLLIHLLDAHSSLGWPR